jgi:hypothetical protein
VFDSIIHTGGLPVAVLELWGPQRTKWGESHVGTTHKMGPTDERRGAGTMQLTGCACTTEGGQGKKQGPSWRVGHPAGCEARQRQRLRHRLGKTLWSVHPQLQLLIDWPQARAQPSCSHDLRSSFNSPATTTSNCRKSISQVKFQATSTFSSFKAIDFSLQIDPHRHFAAFPRLRGSWLTFCSANSSRFRARSSHDLDLRPGCP